MLNFTLFISSLDDFNMWPRLKTTALGPGLVLLTAPWVRCERVCRTGVSGSHHSMNAELTTCLQLEYVPVR